MSSFWRADDSVKVGETKISIPSENGLSYKPGQKIQIFVDSSTKFMDGRETYLDFNVKLSLPAGKKPTRLQLDQLGGSSLIKNIRIYDGSRGQLLEEINSYDSYVAVKYDYDKDASIENMRALREGSAVWQPGNRGTLGTSRTGMANTLTNPYFKRTTGNQAAAQLFDDSDFLTAKCCIPLHTGVFANSTTIMPVMLLDGLYIEIDLNDGPRVIKQLDSVMRDVRTPLNPILHSTNGTAAPAAWVAGATGSTDTFYVGPDQNLSGTDRVARFPFVVGERIGMCLAVNNGTATVFSADANISAINLSTTANAGEGLIEVILDAAVESSILMTPADNWVMYSTSVAAETSYAATYEVSNVNLIVSQVHLDPGYEAGMLQKVREGKAIEFDISSLTNYKHSILPSDRQTTFQIFAQNSRAKSLLVVPQDSTVYTSAQLISASGTYSIAGSDYSSDVLASKNTDDTSLAASRSGYTGIIDGLTAIQYTIDGQRVPSREISTRKMATRESIDAYHLYELEKCLDNAEIEPKSFMAFRNNFVFGRGFSAGGQKGAMDLRGKDLAVVLKYLDDDVPPVKGKLFNSYVFHLRRLMIREGAVEIIQ